jgi:Ca2+-binding RTX toxin-like protein
VRRLARLAAVVATVAVLAGLGMDDVASAGFLQSDTSGNLLFNHLNQFESYQAHDVVIEPDGARFRITDANADIFICPGPAAGCLRPPCARGATDREAVCDPVPALRVALGDSNDRLDNRTSLPMFACGGAGSDVLTGGSGAETLGGGPGRDEVRGGGGNDSLAVDVARMLAFDPAAPPPPGCAPGDPERFELLDGGSGRDRIEGGPGDDLAFGGEGDDTALGFAGDDRLDGGAGRDDLAGLDGADVVSGGADNDYLFGGPGSDDLDGGAGDDDLGRTLRYDADGLGTGTAVATAAEDGDDRLDGGDGSDHLTAGPGAALFDTTDSLALLQHDIVDRRLQSAVLNGADRFAGGPGDDLVTYVNRDLPVVVTLDGLANDGSAGEGDRVDADVERVWGGARADVMGAAPGGSLLFGDLGPDRIVCGPGPDRLSGGFDDGADTITGARGDDQLVGAPGDDTLDGGAGTDLVLGGSGDDAAAGGPGDDRLEGAAGSDRLDGGAGADCLHGFLLPAAEPPCATGLSPTLAAGADGADVLHGGAGVDRLWGGDGDDVADYSDARTRVVVVLPGSAGTPAAATADVLGADVEGARGGRGADTLIGNAADNALDGGPGDDHIDGAAGVDRLRGGSGQDVIVARDGGPDAVRCGTKRDFALIDGDDELVAALSDVCERVDGGGSSLGRRVGPSGGCALAIRPPGASRWFPLRLRASLPARTVVDASSCPARLGRALVRLGAFALQPARRRLVVALRGGRAGACRDSGLRIRRLEVRRAPAWLAVRGRDLTASGAGASWTTIDGCRGTRVEVRSGRVRTKR